MYLLLSENFPFLYHFFRSGSQQDHAAALVTLRDGTEDNRHLTTAKTRAQLCKYILCVNCYWKENCACTIEPYSKLDVNIDLRDSAAFHSTKMALISTVEQD